MTFKASTWIGRNALRKLKESLVNLELDDDLIESIDDYLSVNNTGDYLMNIFTSEEVRRLSELEKD